MKVLVTGATGFVGRQLVAHLARVPGMTVRAAVRSAGARGATPFSATWRDVDVVIAPDLGTAGDWANALSGVDVVVHLAARVHVMRESAREPLTEYRRINTQGTLQLARHAAKAGVRRFVYVSTIKVNGESTRAGQPFTENDMPAPADPYGVSKAEAERGLFELAAGAPGMAVVIVRPPLVYGPGVKGNFLALTRWLRRGVVLPFGGLTGNRRSLVGIDNLVDLLTTCITHPDAANQIFLVSDGEDVSTAELLRRTARALGVRERLIGVPPALLAFGAALVGRAELWLRLGGNLQVDITKARSLLGWTPPLTLDEGLRRAVQGLERADA